MNRVYLDHNATTPVDPRVLEEMAKVARTCPGNPESPHRAGREARARREEARERIAARIGADPTEIVFTSGGTEANNLALRGAISATAPGRRHIVTTGIEHSAVLKTAQMLEGEGFRLTVVAPQADGSVSVDAFAGALRPDTALASVMAANHETGVVQPVAEMAETAREREIVFHTDAVQVLGKAELDLGRLPVSLLSASAHKFGGPPGVGFLFIRAGTGLRAILGGGEQERGYRPGTASVPMIAGFALALDLADEDRAGTVRRWVELSGRLLSGLRSAVPGLAVNGADSDRLPNTLNLSFPGVAAEALVMALDREGIEISSGSACASGAALPSHVLRAMKLPPERLESAVRICLGRGTTTEEIDRSIEVIPRVVARLSG